MTYTFYVFCPYFCTGGPESLHQLAGALRDLGQTSYMWYFGEKYNNLVDHPIIPDYSHYNLKTSNHFYLSDIDKPDCIWILPEGMNPAFYSEKRKAKCVIWYLATKTGNVSALSYTAKCLDEYWILAQSDCAYQQVVEARGDSNRLLRVYDYTKQSLIFPEEVLAQEDRIAQVLYNPAKGAEHTNEIRKYLPDIRFVPIRGATEPMLVDLGLKSKIYIDFGHHPGRDRLPREMAMLGAIVLTGADNTAGNNVDVPIPEFKFTKLENGRYDYSLIADVIRNCMERSHQLFSVFKSYRDIVREEKATMYQQTETFIQEICQ